ncbi:MAG: NTP/NDP exchange transporter [Planctomycetota bacterium]|jgi:AAA family ATP:ADP antiporter
MSEPPREQPDSHAGEPDGGGDSLWWRLAKVEPGEVKSLLLACAYFFCLLAGYYMVRPLRDAMGTESGMPSLKWLYLGTACTMLPASLIFSALTTRVGRGRFIPWAYRFFIVTFLGFFVLLTLLPEGAHMALQRVFFVWLSVFSLFGVSVFWSFMTDLFTNRQARRLFGVIAVGGTLGHTFGSFMAGQLAGRIGGTMLLLAGAVLLEASCWCVHGLNALARRRVEAGGGDERGRAEEESLGGRAWDGLRDIVRSPYLIGISLFILCHAVSSTFLYFIKQHAAEAIFDVQEERVQFFASIDFWTGVLTIIGQVFLTSRVIARFGVGVTLSVVPVITIVGFAILGLSLARPELLPVAGVVLFFEPLRRAGNFIFSRPAREVLYTVVRRDEKYKAKNFIDTFVYRAGDLAAAWIFFGAAAVAIATMPLAAVWLLLGLSLGRKQRALAQA